MTSPPDTEQPGPRTGDWPVFVSGRVLECAWCRPVGRLPAVEPPRGRGRIQDNLRHFSSHFRRRRSVLARVQQHVSKRISHLPRRPQQPRMVAIGDHPPLRPPHHPVHRERQPRPNRHHPAPERMLILRFDDQVGVIPEQRVVHEPKLGAVASGGKGTLSENPSSPPIERAIGVTWASALLRRRESMGFSNLFRAAPTR